MIEVNGQKIWFQSAEEFPEEFPDDIDLVITSPPYWDLKDYNHEDQIGSNGYEEYLERMEEVWQNCYEHTSENAIMIVIVNSRRRKKKYYDIPGDIARNCGDWEFIEEMIWYKPNAMPMSHYYKDKLYDDKKESILVFAKNREYDYTFNKIRVDQKYKDADPRDNKDQNGRGIPNIIRCPAYKPPKVRESNYHTAAFPDRLTYALMYTYSNPDDKVLDPFSGSGTVLKIARNTGREGYGLELNPEYKNLLKDRIKEDFKKPSWEELDIINSSTEINPTNTKEERREKDKKIDDY